MGCCFRICDRERCIVDELLSSRPFADEGRRTSSLPETERKAGGMKGWAMLNYLVESDMDSGDSWIGARLSSASNPSNSEGVGLSMRCMVVVNCGTVHRWVVVMLLRE